MKILFVVILIFVLLLLYSIKIVYNITLNNFDFSAKVTLKLPFSKELFNSKKKSKQKSSDKEKQEKQDKKKIDLETLRKLKDPAIDALTEVCKVLKKHCRIQRIDTKAKAALADPMENGIAFGILSGVLNVTTFILKEKCSAKKVNLEILSDFYSGEGLIFESRGTLRVRPLILITAIVFNLKLIKSIKVITDILKEEKKNG